MATSAQSNHYSGKSIEGLEIEEMANFKKWLVISTPQEQMHTLWSMFRKDDEYPSDVHKIKKLKLDIGVTIYPNSPNYVIPLMNRLALHGYLELKKIGKGSKTSNETRLYSMTPKGIELLKLIETFVSI